MGSAACLLSAAAFGVMAVFAKLAYEDGVGLHALLLVRFGLAGALLLAMAQMRRRFRGWSRRAVVTGLAMGAVGYASQAGLYFAALTRADAAQVALIFCLYPLLVMVTAVVMGTDTPSRRRGVALVLALVGVALVLGGGTGGNVDIIGAGLAFGSAVVYTGYILVGDRVAGADPLAFAALVCAGALGTFASWSLVQGAPDLGFEAEGWLWLALLALVSTVGAIVLFFVGLARVGATVASLLSSIEPVVTVAGAALVFGDSMTVQQAVGGALVLATVVLVQWPTGGNRGTTPPRRRTTTDQAPLISAH